MIIELSHQQKIALMEAVQGGALDTSIFDKKDAGKEMTEGEINAEIDRLTLLSPDEACDRMRRLGICKMCDKCSKVTK